tara:strand:- start:453 stop:1031 length:579 start_codon:yes stop_codon:yes gene_type:complete
MQKKNSIVKRSINNHFNLKKMMNKYSDKIQEVSQIISDSVLDGGCIYWCGNGGSAADAQHLAAELVGRFEKERRPIKSISLNTDTSVLTALSNDYSYENVFSRQLEALASTGDILVVFSTSGNSKNIIKVLKQSKAMGVTSVAILGNKGGRAKKFSDFDLSLPLKDTARIQEMHILIGHIISSIVEKNCIEN